MQVAIFFPDKNEIDKRVVLTLDGLAIPSLYMSEQLEVPN